jgi:succinoglycan biosynthesis protein ExoL
MTISTTPKILLLAQDLSDAAIKRRIEMLRAGGALITIAGFRRAHEPIHDIAGSRPIDLGQTYNVRFVQRCLSVLREIFLLARHKSLFTDADIIIARNLEMLAIGVRGRSLCKAKPLLVYECLDIHRLMLNEGPVGMVLRALEGWLSRRASALLTSSPAFVNGYFKNHSHVKLPIRMIENKLLVTNENDLPAFVPRKPGPPWIIGWFGILRCKKSLQTLANAVMQSEGRLEVVIRGKPARDQLTDFEDILAQTTGLRFQGPYRNPDHLQAIYRDVHFSWAIDMLDEHLNSSLLLPNRLYEGGAFSCVPIAIASVETGRFLRELGVGVTTHERLTAFLVNLSKTLTAEHYAVLESAAHAVPRSVWICTREDCKELVRYLISLR